MNNFLETLKAFCLTAGVKLIGAIAVVVIGFALTSWLIKLLRKSKGMQHVEKGAQGFILTCLNVVLKAVIVLTAASILGVPMTNVVAILGSCGLAVGLALQGSLSNFAGGLMLLIFKPFVVGDFVESIGISGTVTEISILYTTIITADNRRVVVPNGSLSNAVVINVNKEGTRRQDIEISVAYGTDIEKAKKVILDIINAKSELWIEPAPVVNITNYADSAITLTLRFWTKAGDYWTLRGEVNNEIEAAFKKNGIEIPFPQLDVHLDK